MAPNAPELCSAAADAMARVGKLADCTLMAADGSSYWVSKAMMSAASNVLGTMFNSVEPYEHCVRLDDSPAEVACLVNHAYGGYAFLIDIDNLLACSRMADKYDMPRLQEVAAAFVKQLELSDSNVACCIAIAHASPGLCELKERSMDYVAKRLQHVIKHRVDEKKCSTDWLEALPQSTLVDLMQRRCRIIGGRSIYCKHCSHRWQFATPMTDAEIAQLEA